MTDIDSIMEENKHLVDENNYLRKLVAKFEFESNLYCMNEIVHSYDHDCADFKVLIKENKHLKNKCTKLEQNCTKLEQERNYYMSSGGGGNGVDYDLFEKYVGLYNKEKNTLFVHHFVDKENIYPYGCYQFEGDYACYSVRGSWDNWSKEYTLKTRCVRDSDGIYEGYVYYIIAENIIHGNDYEFKFKDADGNWIEPVYDEESEDDADCNIKIKQNNNGIWNAVITAR